MSNLGGTFFRMANGGTLFLDEVGEIPPSVQAKLLRALQHKEVRPVGSSKTQKVDVRVIAATHQDLPSLIKQGRFREDLYYRLNVMPIEVPALRDRIEDLPLLIHHFLDLARQERNSRIEGVSDQAMQRLMDYHWPGNVRELENLAERLSLGPTLSRVFGHPRWLVGDLGGLVILVAIAGGYLAGRRAGVKLLVGAMRGKTLAGPAE